MRPAARVGRGTQSGRVQPAQDLQQLARRQRRVRGWRHHRDPAGFSHGQDIPKISVADIIMINVSRNNGPEAGACRVCDHPDGCGEVFG